MYLARGVLNPASRQVQRDLADAASLHRTVMKTFPDQVGDQARKALAVLHRVDEDRRRGEFVLFLQSARPPDFSRLPAGYFASLAEDLDLALAGATENPRIRPVKQEREAIAFGDRFVFRLRANTTKKVRTKSLPDGTKRNGTRVPVRKDHGQLRWLGRRAAEAGFKVETVQIGDIPPLAGRSRERLLTFAGVRFDGVLTVIDADAFRAALANGIGPAKAFGFGLLSLSRARE
jgi:CRISPR system Cascade subunit CasE